MHLLDSMDSKHNALMHTSSFTRYCPLIRLRQQSGARQLSMQVSLFALVQYGAQQFSLSHTIHTVSTKVTASLVQPPLLFVTHTQTDRHTLETLTHDLTDYSDNELPQ